MSGACGSCTLCCKVLGVTVSETYEKPQYTQCKFCNKNGCKIYEKRPMVCASFKCMYLKWQEEGQNPPSYLRPDRSRVVLVPNTEGKVIIFAIADQGINMEKLKGTKFFAFLLAISNDVERITIIFEGDILWHIEKELYWEGENS